jgi:site-specific recombinase XerD
VLGNFSFQSGVTSASVIANFELKRLNMGNCTYPFRKATLNNCDGNLENRWYIIFYVWDIQQRKMVRKRDYSVNNYSTTIERNAFAKQRIKSINELLEDGYHIDANKKSEVVGSVEEGTTLEKALRNVLEIKKQTFRQSSYLSFSSTLNCFLAWTLKNRLSNINVRYLDRMHAISFVDHLIVDEQLSGKTINGKISYLKSLFNELIEREIIKENPFVKIKKRKEVKTYQNLAYTDAEITKLKEAIEKKDIELWTFVLFIYYCYLRPIEIRALTMENVNLKTHKIFVPANISKNGKEAYIDIPSPFMNFLENTNFFKDKKGLLFKNRNGKAVGKNVMTYRHKTYIDNLTMDNVHTLYSWKHTGVVKAYKAGVDIKSIQRQCRHSSIEMTDNYLKSLGMYNNDEFLLKMPSI